MKINVNGKLQEKKRTLKIKNKIRLEFADCCSWI